MVRGVEVGGAGKGGGDFTFNNSKIKICNPYNLNNSTLAKVRTSGRFYVFASRFGYFWVVLCAPTDVGTCG